MVRSHLLAILHRKTKPLKSWATEKAGLLIQSEAKNHIGD